MDTGLPDFFRLEYPNLSIIPLNDETGREYENLFAVWLIEIVLFFDSLRRPGRDSIENYFELSEFRQFVGISAVNIDKLQRRFEKFDDPEEAVRKHLREILTNRVRELRKSKFPVNLPYFININRLGDVLDLNDVEKSVLAFCASFDISEPFKQIISLFFDDVTQKRYCALLHRLTGHPTSLIQNAMSKEGTLATTGILYNPKRFGAFNISEMADLMPGLGPALLEPLEEDGKLIDFFLKQVPRTNLGLDAFGHISQDTAALLSYLRNVLERAEAGSNILLYGPPGTGKTEYVKALSQELGVDLFEVNYANKSGDPIQGAYRLRCYSFCQSILRNNRRALLLFDEIEDVFQPPRGQWSLFEGDGKEEQASTDGKAWINRTLERNPVPSLWVTNNPNIDPAYLRRFDFSVRFPVPPQKVRLSIAQHHLGHLSEGNEEWLKKIAASNEQTPAQIERAARFAELASGGDKAKCQALVELALNRSARLLGQRTQSALPSRHLKFDLRYVNANLDFKVWVNSLTRSPRGSFCLYGPPGTGKSELARELALEIGKESIVMRASNLLSPWVGQTEQNIATMFQEARDSESVIILDEADSFLADRSHAVRNWEVTQVNEFLTQMESFDGILICTTNLMDRLDRASLRRFDHKVQFNYLNQEQCQGLFKSVLQGFGGEVPAGSPWLEKVSRLGNLTPGDFAVAHRQFLMKIERPTPDALYQVLVEESRQKDGGKQSIGFTAPLRASIQ